MMVLYTAGGQFLDVTGQDYIGNYHIARNKPYTGIRHIYGQSTQLTPKQSIKQKYYAYAQKFADMLQTYQLDISDIQTITYPVQFKSDTIWHEIYLLKNNETNVIMDVDKSSFSKYKDHPLS